MDKYITICRYLLHSLLYFAVVNYRLDHGKCAENIYKWGKADIKLFRIKKEGEIWLFMIMNHAL